MPKPTAMTLLKSLRKNKLLETKKIFDAAIKETIREEIEKKKIAEANKFFVEKRSKASLEEAVAAEVEPNLDEPDVDSKPILLRPDSSTYRYMVSVMNKTYYVDFTPSEGAASNMAFDMTFYLRNKADSDVAAARYGFSSQSAIKPLLNKIVSVMKIFLAKRQPSMVRLVPGKGAEFPAIFHMEAFKVLQGLQADLKGKYSVSRKQDGDGSAFVVRKGAGGTGLQGRSFRTHVVPDE